MFRKDVVFLPFYHMDRPGDAHLKDCAELFVKLLASQVMQRGASHNTLCEWQCLGLQGHILSLAEFVK